jgi:hypothetical protein
MAATEANHATMAPHERIKLDSISSIGSSFRLWR